MLEYILSSDGIRIAIALGEIDTITKDTRKQVDYICQIDSEGAQIWHTSTGKHILQTILRRDHSEKLARASANIQELFPINTSSGYEKKGTQQTSSNTTTTTNVNLRKEKIPGREELEEMGKRREKDDIGIANRSNEEKVRGDALFVTRKGGAIDLTRLH